jgi:hypothetical protein
MKHPKFKVDDKVLPVSNQYLKTPGIITACDISGIFIQSFVYTVRFFDREGFSYTEYSAYPEKHLRPYIEPIKLPVAKPSQSDLERIYVASLKDAEKMIDSLKAQVKEQKQHIDYLTNVCEYSENHLKTYLKKGFTNDT